MSGIFRSILTASSSLNAISRALANSAHNIANLHTPGFKARRSDFTDVLAGSQGGGTAIAGLAPLLSQGAAEPTARPLDVAIRGGGYLVVENPASGERLYTRNGGLRVDAAGYLIDGNGYRVQGYPPGAAGGLTSLSLRGAAAQPAATSTIQLGVNLDSRSAEAAAGDLPVAGTSTYADYRESASFSTSVPIFDSLGTEHQLDVFFYQTSAADREFEYRVAVDGEAVGEAAGTPVELASGTLSFQADGGRTPPVGPADAVFTPEFANGAQAGPIAISFSPASRRASQSSVGSVVQDGAAAGQVRGVGISGNGSVIAQLDNGRQVTLGTVALANFPNAEGLVPRGGGLFAAGGAAGAPAINNPQTAGAARFSESSLEVSNVDLTTELLTQAMLGKSFAANAKVIRVLDELLEEIVSL